MGVFELSKTIPSWIVLGGVLVILALIIVAPTSTELVVIWTAIGVLAVAIGSVAWWYVRNEPKRTLAAWGRTLTVLGFDWEGHEDHGVGRGRWRDTAVEVVIHAQGVATGRLEPSRGREVGDERPGLVREPVPYGEGQGPFFTEYHCTRQGEPKSIGVRIDHRNKGRLLIDRVQNRAQGIDRRLRVRKKLSVRLRVSEIQPDP